MIDTNRAVARNGSVGGVLVLILPTEGRGLGCGLGSGFCFAAQPGGGGFKE